MDLKPLNLAKTSKNDYPAASLDNQTLTAPGHVPGTPLVAGEPPRENLAGYENNNTKIITMEPYQGNRNQEVNQTESEWIQIKSKNARQRKKQRFIRRFLDTFTTPVNNFPKYYKLKFPRTDIETKLSVITIDKEIKSKIGIPESIKKLNRDTLQIKVKSKEQGDKLSQVKEIATQEVLIEKHDGMNKVKGTVYSDTMANCTIDELQEALESQGVEKIERMKRRIGNDLIETNRYILTFNRTELPRIIKITDWHHEIIDLYIPTPIRCLKCQRYGHLKKWCRREEEVCVNCGEPGHTSTMCSNDTKCLHCKGPHNAMNRKCPTYLFKCEVVATQTRERIPMHEAEDKVKEKYPSEDRSFSLIANGSQSQQPLRPSQRYEPTQRPAQKPHHPSTREQSQQTQEFALPSLSFPQKTKQLKVNTQDSNQPQNLQKSTQSQPEPSKNRSHRQNLKNDQAVKNRLTENLPEPLKELKELKELNDPLMKKSTKSLPTTSKYQGEESRRLSLTQISHAENTQRDRKLSTSSLVVQSSDHDTETKDEYKRRRTESGNSPPTRSKSQKYDINKHNNQIPVLGTKPKTMPWKR